jgi:hypothetical protein
MQVIEDTGLENVWQLMAFLIKECGWSSTDNVDMLYEESSWTEIGQYVKSGYKSHYDVYEFD